MKRASLLDHDQIAREKATTVHYHEPQLAREALNVALNKAKQDRHKVRYYRRLVEALKYAVHHVDSEGARAIINQALADAGEV